MSNAKQGQSFFDKVVQQTGSIENTMLMAVLNNVSITNDAALGSELKSAGTIQNRVVSALLRRSEPATALAKTTAVAFEDYGIGTMTISSTLKIY